MFFLVPTPARLLARSPVTLLSSVFMIFADYICRAPLREHVQDKRTSTSRRCVVSCLNTSIGAQKVARVLRVSKSP